MYTVLKHKRLHHTINLSCSHAKLEKPPSRKGSGGGILTSTKEHSERKLLLPGHNKATSDRTFRVLEDGVWLMFGYGFYPVMAYHAFGFEKVGLGVSFFLRLFATRKATFAIFATARSHLHNNFVFVLMPIKSWKTRFISHRHCSIFDPHRGSYG